MASAMRIFEISKMFPVEERYSLTDQIRRSSRSVCANLAEAWRKRRYEAHFVSKLTMPKAKRRRLVFGSSFPLDAVTFHNEKLRSSTTPSTESSASSCA